MIVFPKQIPIIKLDGFFLAAITSSHLQDYFNICSSTKVMHAYGLQEHKSLSETEFLIKFLDQEFQNKRMIRWGVFLDSDPVKLIGDVGFWRFVDVRRRAEIGAKLDSAYWRNGYISAAISAIARYGFKHMNIHSIEGNVDPNNFGSHKMVEKLGFEREGYLKEHSFNPISAKFHDTILFTLRQKNESI